MHICVIKAIRATIRLLATRVCVSTNSNTCHKKKINISVGTASLLITHFNLQQNGRGLPFSDLGSKQGIRPEAGVSSHCDLQGFDDRHHVVAKHQGIGKLVSLAAWQWWHDAHNCCVAGAGAVGRLKGLTCMHNTRIALYS